MSLPIEPLEAWFEAHHPCDNERAHSAEQHHGRVSGARLAGLLGVKPATVRMWRQRGGIPLYSADRAAVALGVHPCELWPDWWDLPEPNHTGGRPPKPKLPDWFRELLRHARIQSWRLRAECPTGRAATLARRMFDMPEPTPNDEETAA